MLIMTQILIVNNIRNVQIIWLMGGLRYEYHMSMSAGASLEAPITQPRRSQKVSFILELPFFVTIIDRTGIFVLYSKP